MTNASNTLVHIFVSANSKPWSLRIHNFVH